MEPWVHEKIVKQKTPYIGNGIPFALFALLACPTLAYRKFNTGILINDQLNVNVVFIITTAYLCLYTF